MRKMILVCLFLFYGLLGADGLIILSDENVLCYNEGSWKPAELIEVNSVWESFIQIPHAKWIWRTAKLTYDDAVDGVSYNFQRKFFIPRCAKNIRAEIEITADNFFSLQINGQFAGSDPTWTTVKRYNVGSYLRTRTNTLSFTVENSKDNTGGPSSNPAGLIFLLKILWDGCDQSISLQNPSSPMTIATNYLTFSQNQLYLNNGKFNSKTYRNPEDF